MVKSYWKNGKIKRDDIYQKDSLIKGVCYDSTGTTIKHFPFSVMPVFKGGEAGLLRFLSAKVHYPYSAMRKGIQGRVIVQFVVAVDGKICDVKVVKKIQQELDKEAIRVVESMPRWKPGMIENEPVRVKYTLPINFRLQ